MAHRRLTPILVADAVGYSARVAVDEDGALQALRGHMEALELVIGLHHGRVIKTMGDGMLVEFASVIDAVSAASIQTRLAERNTDLPEAARFDFRIGVHAGDVVSANDDILVDGVNVAARLEAEAPPGGVAISARVRDSSRTWCARSACSKSGALIRPRLNHRWPRRCPTNPRSRCSHSSTCRPIRSRNTSPTA
jgi:adenylate cyclase